VVKRAVKMMTKPDPTDFTVDLVTREVRHKSGAAVSYYEYPEPADWLSAPGSTLNGHLFDGPLDELAKRAALAAGMTHQRP
jgi:hypothetical protein